MSDLFKAELTQLQAVYKKIAGSTATTILDGSNGVLRVARLTVGENNGGTPALTVEINDGTTSFYLVDDGGRLWNGPAMTAKQGVIFPGLIVPKGSTLKVTSSDASGHMDVMALYSPTG